MDRRTLAAVSLITGAGLAFRLLVFQQSPFGDELSTLYLIQGESLGGVISGVSSDAEISPPFYFVLAWFAARFGETIEMVRLPALLAGTTLIPLTFALARRASGRAAGLLATAFVALAPFMVFVSATGRAYSLMLALLVISCLLLVKATNSGGWWWAAWVLTAAGAMYSHYTAIFVLVAQFAWAVWVRPDAWRRPLTAALAAAALFLPWLWQLRADLDSPTNEVLQSLQGSGLGTKREAFTQWAFGHPVVALDQLPGESIALVMLAACLVAVALALANHRERVTEAGRWLRQNPVLILVGLAALATPLAEAVMALAGNDLLGARNLTASWPFAAIIVAFMVTRSGRVPAIVLGLVLLAGFTYGTVRSVTSHRLPDYAAAASRIEAEARPGDRVVDVFSPPLSPVPLTPLGAELDLPDGVSVYTLNRPLGEPPYLPLTPVADPDRLLSQALNRSSGNVFVLGPRVRVATGIHAAFENGEVTLPGGWRVSSSESFPGLADLELFRVTREP